MDYNINKATKLHSAGSIIPHKNPFEKLEPYKTKIELNKEFVDKWVLPYYLNGIHNTHEFVKNYSSVKSSINIDIVKQLLAEFNWRTRIVGAYFSAIEDYKELEDIIGVNLLKSEVCFAGGGYCFALAYFNTEKSIQYLEKYLDYYLDRKDLDFDQNVAASALNWIDKQNGTKRLDKYMSKYKEWNEDKNYSKVETGLKRFEEQMNTLEIIKSSY